MLRALATRTARRRSGAVLIVVLAMLVLFAVLGLSFVLYSEAQLSAARTQKMSVNEDTEPNPQQAAEGWMGPFIYDLPDFGDDLMNPLRGHSLARSKYSSPGSLLPYAASAPFPLEPVTIGGVPFADARQIVRFSRDRETGAIFDPERVYGANLPRTSAAAAVPGTYQGKNFPFTYPDRHDFYLAQMDPTTGQITASSFHRDDLGSWNSNAGATYFGNQTGGQFKTLRPIPRAGQHQNFPQVPMNPDGTYTGDVSNMKFISTTGGQRNDSYWMDAGGPVLKWRGKFYKAMVAPLVLDLNSRINLSVAGNTKGNGNTHATNQGWGPWVVNPSLIGMPATDLPELVARRHGRATGTYSPPSDPYTSQTYSTRLNGGKLPGAYALIDADGAGPAMSDGPLTLPAANAVNVTPIFNQTATAPHRYEPTQAELNSHLADHPSQFNPLMYHRTPTAGGSPGGFGHDDFMKLYTRFSDPKGRPAQVTSIPAPASTSLASNNQLRQLTTTFSTSQQWGSVQVRTGANATDLATLGPIDLNRPLPDFRRNPALPLSPLNMWSPATELVNYTAAVSARQRLARDIFVRLAARYGLIDGQTTPSGARYLPATGALQVTGPIADTKVQSLAQLAQLAVNLVDYIDGDDIVTPFIWRPADASIADPWTDTNNTSIVADASGEIPLNTRVVYGTEKPRLVLSEVHSGLYNDPNDEMTMPAMANLPLERRYWVELHNPLPDEPTDSGAHGDLGAARLRYDPATTLLPDPTSTATPVPMVPATVNITPYRVEVAVVDSGMGVPSQPYTAFLVGGGTGAVAADTTGAGVFGTALKARVSSFMPNAAPTRPSSLTGDQINLVTPVGATGGQRVAGNGGNAGYYVLGPKEAFEEAGVNSSMSLADSVAGVPPVGMPVALPVDTLCFDATPGPADDAAITTEAGRVSVVLLRRLVNPYLPPQEDSSVANYNPYITVDYLENVPTRDRVIRSNMGMHTPPAATDVPSIGRVHPYTAGPVYGSGTPAVVDQTGAVNPPHTFFNLAAPNSNSFAQNNRMVGTANFGFEWLVHLDRELVSLPEAAHVSRYSPGLLTQQFFNGTVYHGHECGLTTAVTLPQFGVTPIYPLAETSGLLCVGSRLPGTPLGGREPGKVNINTVNAANLLNAVFDPQVGNGFTTTYPAFVNDVWNNCIAPATPPMGLNIARTANRVPRATVHEDAAGTDHPFSFGATYSPFNDTLIGRRTTSDTSGSLVFLNGMATGNHPYLQNEPLQKGYNNLTSVSDSFLVIMTVGFFEVENAGPWSVDNQPQLGHEIFDKVPGDLRAQFAGVVDRSCLTVRDPQSASLVPGDGLPFQTKLTSDVIVGSTQVEIEAVPPGGTIPLGFPGATTVVPANTCAILGHGEVLFVNATAAVNTTNRLWVGYGNGAGNTGDGDWLTVGAAITGDPANRPGRATITVTASTRIHSAGTMVLGATPVTGVANAGAVFGNPGPQVGVTLAQLKQRGLVPYFTRLEP